MRRLEVRFLSPAPVQEPRIHRRGASRHSLRDLVRQKVHQPVGSGDEFLIILEEEFLILDQFLNLQKKLRQSAHGSLFSTVTSECQ